MKNCEIFRFVQLFNEWSGERNPTHIWASLRSMLWACLHGRSLRSCWIRGCTATHTTAWRGWTWGRCCTDLSNLFTLITFQLSAVFLPMSNFAAISTSVIWNTTRLAFSFVATFALSFHTFRRRLPFTLVRGLFAFSFWILAFAILPFWLTLVILWNPVNLHRTWTSCCWITGHNSQLSMNTACWKRRTCNFVVQNHGTHCCIVSCWGHLQMKMLLDVLGQNTQKGWNHQIIRQRNSWTSLVLVPDTFQGLNLLEQRPALVKGWKAHQSL